MLYEVITNRLLDLEDENLAIPDAPGRGFLLDSGHHIGNLGVVDRNNFV